MSQDSLSMKASQLHHRAIVIDGHCDILNPLADGRVRLSERTEVEPPETWRGADYVRMPPNNTPYDVSAYSWYFECIGQYDIPRFQEGGITAEVMAIFIAEEYLHRPLERALDMVAAFHREIESNPDTLLMATTAADIQQAKSEDKTALMLGFEGAEPLLRNLTLLDVFYRLGLRIMSLTHSRRNDFADGTQMSIATGGLTTLGRQLIARMNDLGILIDLAHMNDVGVWEVLELSSEPVVLSHTTVAEMPGYKSGLLEIDPRYGKSKLQAIAEKGGVAGAIFVAQPSLNAVVDDIEAMIQHVGDDYVSIGSDFVSLAHVPPGLEDISKLPAITEALLRRGYSDETIMKVLGGNLMRVFQTVLG